MPMTVVIRRVAVLAAAAAVLAACSTHAPKAGVEDQIRTKLGTTSASCPADLDGTVGSTITCSAIGNGETFDVKVSVTSNQGGTINFDIERVGGAPPAPKEEVADASAGVVDGQEVAQAVFDQLTQTVGQQPDKVSCPDLPATVGASVRCDLVAGPDTLGVTVTTSSVEGTKVNFDIAVDGKAS
jgi:Domain of unknown function (DUF4333)